MLFSAGGVVDVGVLPAARFAAAAAAFDAEEDEDEVLQQFIMLWRCNTVLQEDVQQMRTAVDAVTAERGALEKRLEDGAEGADMEGENLKGKKRILQRAVAEQEVRMQELEAQLGEYARLEKQHREYNLGRGHQGGKQPPTCRALPQEGPCRVLLGRPPLRRAFLCPKPVLPFLCVLY